MIKYMAIQFIGHIKESYFYPKSDKKSWWILSGRGAEEGYRNEILIFKRLVLLQGKEQTRILKG